MFCSMCPTLLEKCTSQIPSIFWDGLASRPFAHAARFNGHWVALTDQLFNLTTSKVVAAALNCPMKHFTLLSHSSPGPPTLASTLPSLYCKSIVDPCGRGDFTVTSLCESLHSEVPVHVIAQ